MSVPKPSPVKHHQTLKCYNPFQLHAKKKRRTRNAEDLVEITENFASLHPGIGLRVGLKLCSVCRKWICGKKYLRTIDGNQEIRLVSSGQEVTPHKQIQIEPLAASTPQTNNKTEHAELEQAKKKFKEDKIIEINKMISTISPGVASSSGNDKRIIEKAKEGVKNLSSLIDEDLIINDEVRKKACDFDSIMENIKSSFPKASNKEKKTLLQLLPPQWKLNKVRTELNNPDITWSVWNEAKKNRETYGALQVPIHTKVISTL